MTKFRLTIACFATLLMFASIPNLALAERGYGWGGGHAPGAALGFFGRSPSTLYNLGYIPVPPYFALHPPVYYGQRVYRSYGESPFARSGMRRYDVQLAIPKEIVNRYVQQAAPAEVEEAVTADAQVAVQPKLILNPFFHQADKQLVKAN